MAEGADLRSANLFRADLSGAISNLTHLVDATLTEANSARATFKGADLTKVNSGRAVLRYADLRAAMLQGAGLEQSLYNDATLYNAAARGRSIVGPALESVTELGKFAGSESKCLTIYKGWMIAVHASDQDM